MSTLDVDAVKAFVMVADLLSFTKAAQALGTTQSTLSIKVRRLEERLGARLMERTPRKVALSLRGMAFLPAAREFVAAHDRAISDFSTAPYRLALGFVDHVAGPELPILLTQLHAFDPCLTLKIKIDTTSNLMEKLDLGQLDAVVVHDVDDRRRGEVLSLSRYGWFAAPSFNWQRNEPLRLAMPSTDEANPDRLRATRALEAAGIAWNETFVGGGGAAVNIAVSTGLAIAALAYRAVNPGFIDVGATFGLPPLPASRILLYKNTLLPQACTALRMLTAAAFSDADRAS